MTWTKAMDYATKLQDATQLLRECVGEQGMWADTHRYRYMCWTRDFVIASMHALPTIGRGDVAKRHLTELSLRQRHDGKIPIVFLDRTLPFLYNKTRESIRDRRLSFTLSRWLKGGFENLTPGTRDSEILYLVGMMEFAHAAQDESLLTRYSAQVQRAIAYIESRLMKDGLVIGCDWRDTMEKELGDQPLLSNNALLYHAFVMLGMERKARLLRDRILETFVVNGRFIDRPKEHRFDPFGGALAVIYGIARWEHRHGIVESFREVDTPHGVTIRCRHNAYTPEEIAIINETDGVVVWPFIGYYSAVALHALGYEAFAADQYHKIRSLPGLWEWHHPQTGRGYGSPRQLWTAALLMHATDFLHT